MLGQLVMNPACGKAVHDVNEETVHAHDDEREDELPLPGDLDEPVEKGEHDEHPAAAEKRPGWRPDALHNGASDDADDGAKKQADDRRSKETPTLLSLAALAGEEEVPCDGSTQHGGEGWDEIQRGVTARIGDERLRGGEEIEEPAVKVSGCIQAFAPMSEESRKQIFFRGADGREVEAGSRQRVLNEPEPISCEDHDDGRRAVLPAKTCEDEEEDVAKANLGEHIGKLPDSLRIRRSRGEEYSEQDEDHRACQCMPGQAEKALALRFSSAHRKGNGDADHEHEARLDEIPKSTALPGDVAHLP